MERRTADRDPQFFDIVISPVGRARQPILGASLAFLDVTSVKAMRTELRRTNEELETAYEELQSSNEELETTNEELQSTVEELETTNEELQSTNEELETTNEELRSTNEELEALNAELVARTAAGDNVTAYLTSIVDGVAIAVVVLDSDLTVRTWNAGAEEMWGLRADEVIGQPFFDLDIGLPVDKLRLQIDATGSDRVDADDMVVAAVNRRGRAVQCRVRFAQLAGSHRAGVVLLMEEVDRAG